MTYEEALQIAMEELDEKIEYLSDTFEGHSAGVESYIYSLSMARKALIKALDQPKREWVGLKKEDRDSVLAGSWFVLDDQAMDKIEAILKEKNT